MKSNNKIREATPSDYTVMGHIHNDCFGQIYDGAIQETPEKLTQDWQNRLADHSEIQVLVHGTPVNGFIAYGPVLSPPPSMKNARVPLYTREIYGLYIDPASHRTGIGRALMQAACTQMLEEKHKGLVLWVLEKNHNAIAFYTALNGESCGKKNSQFGTRTLREKAYGWRDINKIY